MTALPRGWFGTDLGPRRPCKGTYCFFETTSLPPLPALDGSFGWLPTDPPFAHTVVEHRTAPAPAPVEPGLPPEFVSFIGQPALMAAVPSCTACYWSLAPATILSPLDDGARLLRFLSDQQDVLHWYLWLGPGGEHRVLCSPIDHHHVTVPPERAQQALVEVAPSFEAFLYRFWVENLTWYEVARDRLADDDLTPAVRGYLAKL